MTLQKPYAHNHILSAHLLFLHYTNVSVHPCVAPLWYFITLNTKQPIGKNGTHIFWTHRGVSGPDNLTTLHHHCFLSMTVRLSINPKIRTHTVFWYTSSEFSYATREDRIEPIFVSNVCKTDQTGTMSMGACLGEATIAYRLIKKLTVLEEPSDINIRNMENLPNH